MEQPAGNDSPTPATSSTLAADSLATGVMFMLGVAVLQRLVGFARSILFCRFLDDDQLGQWSLAFSFLLLAAPLAVLGLTGCFGRYVEHYRQRDLLRGFLCHSARLATLFGLVAVALVVLGRRWFAWLIFRDPEQTGMVLLVAGTLGAIIAFNFLLEVMRGLRRVRLVTLMELICSLTFAGIGLSLLSVTRLGTAAAIIAYGGGCLAATAVAVWMLRSTWTELPAREPPLPQSQLLGKLAPFAAWLWVGNLLTNLFDMSDRYMIVHLSGLPAEEGAALVGQYFSSLVVPLLLVAVTGMLSGVLLPYLSHDWECGRREQVSRRLNLALKLTSLGLLSGGVAILLGRYWLFDWALGGKYPQGLAVLPWTVVSCCWIALWRIAFNFLLCAEKAHFGSVAMLTGLLTNVLLNALLLPRLGLPGAAIATGLANGLTLALILLLSWRLGQRMDGRVCAVCLLPLALTWGPYVGAAVLLATLWAILRGRVVFTVGERAQIEELLSRGRQVVHRFAQLRVPTAGTKGGTSCSTHVG